MIYYSVVIFTTLAFSDLVPKTPEVAEGVMAEVALGCLVFFAVRLESFSVFSASSGVLSFVRAIRGSRRTGPGFPKILPAVGLS